MSPHDQWLRFRAATNISCKPDCEECPLWGGPDEFGLCEIAGMATEFVFEKDEQGELDLAGHVQPDWCPRLRPADWPPCDGCPGCA
jgi:hypothetical protein